MNIFWQYCYVVWHSLILSLHPSAILFTVMEDPRPELWTLFHFPQMLTDLLSVSSILGFFVSDVRRLQLLSIFIYYWIHCHFSSTKANLEVHCSQRNTYPFIFPWMNCPGPEALTLLLFPQILPDHPSVSSISCFCSFAVPLEQHKLNIPWSSHLFK